MKKTEKILGGLLLVLLFCGAVLFFNTYQPKEEEEETQKKEFSIKTPKQIFELGEDAEIGDMVYNVSEAELIEDYEKIDDYYKERKYVLSPYEYIKTVGWYSEHYYDIFPGDVRFLRMKYSVTNNSDAKSEFSPDSLYVTSIIGGEMTEWKFETYDVRGTSKGGKKEIKLEGKNKREDKNANQVYTLSPAETMEIEVVGEFYISMYSSVGWDSESDNYNLYLMKNSSTQRIHLNIAGSFGNETDSYAQIREIQKMKYESWTNLERSKWRRSGSKLGDIEEIIESSEPGQQFVDIYEEKLGLEGELVSGFCLETILENFQIVEWKDMPDVFTEQGNLQGMAERYQNIYGCAEEELKILLLDLTYISSEIGELES